MPVRMRTTPPIDRAGVIRGGSGNTSSAFPSAVVPLVVVLPDAVGEGVAISVATPSETVAEGVCDAVDEGGCDTVDEPVSFPPETLALFVVSGVALGLGL